MSTNSVEPGAGTTAPDGASKSAPRTTDGLAVATLVLGVLGFLVITIPIGLILGIAAFARTGRTGRKGKGLAAAGLVLSVLWAAGLGVAVMTALDTAPKRDARGQIETPTDTRPDALKVGDCVAGMTEGEVSSVRAVPCDRPGSGKVFATFELGDGSWPGEAKLDSVAGDGCTSRYRPPSEPAEPEREIIFIRPTEDTWSVGDRTVICVAA